MFNRIKIVILFVLLITSSLNVCAYPKNKITNQEKFFLRLSEKYDTELNIKWKNAIDDRVKIINEIKKSNQYDKYSEYINYTKKTKEYRCKNKHIRYLNINIKKGNEEKIKRHLTLLLNIFLDENLKLKEYFGLN